MPSLDDDSPVRGRRRNRKQRRRGSDSDPSDDEWNEDREGGGFGGWKMGAVIGVIAVCFAVVYPHVFHPLLMSMLGRGETQPPQRNDRPPMHPGMGGRGPPQSGRPGAGDHPAMRMAAAQAESKGGSGGTRSMYAWLMPIYMVGVVVFLVWTIFFKKKKKRNRRRSGGLLSSEDEDDDDIRDRRGKFGRNRKLRDLQDRLKQTESAMAKILEQIEKAQADGSLDVDAMTAYAKELDEKKKGKEKKEKKSPAKPPKKAAKKDEKSAETVQYMADLERALSDFKELSELYEDAKGGSSRRKEASESENDSESSGDDSAHPFPREEEEEEEEGEEGQERSEEEEGEEEEKSEEEDDGRGPSTSTDTRGSVEEVEQKEEEEGGEEEEDDDVYEVEEEETREPTPPPPPPTAGGARRRKPNKI